MSAEGARARRLRIVYLIDKLHRAGAQMHLVQLVPGLDRAAFEAEVVALLTGGAAAGALVERGVRVDVLGLGRLYAPRGIAGLARLARRLRAGRVDVLHTYLASANVFGALAGRLAGVRAIVTSRRDTGFSRNWRLRLLEERLVNPRADRVIAVAPAVAAAAVRERGIRPERVLTIPNGVDLDAFDPARHPRAAARAAAERLFGLAPDEPALGAIGSLTPVKGHEELLAAAARVFARRPRGRVVLVGDGPLRARLEAQAARLGIGDRLLVTGARDDVACLLSALDVVVLPSHSEGLSNALLEAMAMARPVVATAVGGNPDVLQDRVSGRLVPDRDPAALAAAIQELLDDPAQAAALGREARRLVGARFGVRQMVARHEAVYRELAGC